MERIDAAQARDHIEMVDRILAESQPAALRRRRVFRRLGHRLGLHHRALCSSSINGRLPVRGALVGAVRAIVAAPFSAIFRSATDAPQCSQRSSLVQREFFNVLWLTIGLAFVVDVAVYRIFTGMASAAIWSVAEAIVLLYIGMHGNRRAQVAGVLVVVSLVAANFAAPALAGYVLAAGMLVGYAGFGASELLARE